MSILIKGVEIPQEMRLFLVFPNGYTAIYDSKDAFVGEAKAVAVPPHGDLVDRDEMFVEFVVEGQKTTRYKVGEKWELNGAEIRRVIQRLPTVIPAEESET